MFRRCTFSSRPVVPRHFFIDALSHLAERPMWQPRWLTIDDLMQEVSGLHSGERIRLIAELYKVYSACHDEPFDKFYFWGEMLLNDFDTIDKYRVDADALFRNIYELKELESDVSYLTPEQLEVIRQFWANFTDGATLSEEKRRFLAVWRTLGDVYHGFRARLQRQRIAYGGMMQRAAAERRWRAISLSPSGGAMSWRDSMPFRPARRCCSVFCNTTPKPISIGITTTTI